MLARPRNRQVSSVPYALPKNTAQFQDIDFIGFYRTSDIDHVSHAESALRCRRPSWAGKNAVDKLRNDKL